MSPLSAFSLAAPEGILFWTMSAVLLLTGGLVAATPFLMPKGECFAVAIPDAASSDSSLRRFRKMYASAIGILTVALLLTCGCVFAIAGSRAFVGVYVGSMVGLCILSYALMLRFRSLVKRRKRAMGWQSAQQERVAFVGDEPLPHAISMRWDLLMLIGAAVAAVLAVTLYPLMPERIVLQVGFDGQTSNWADKSPAVAAFPVAFGLFIFGAMVFTHWSIVRSKKASNPAAPAATAWAYGMFARAQSILVVGLGVLLSLVGPLMELTFAGLLSLPQLIAPILAVVLVAVIASMAVSVGYGQNGSRLIARIQSEALVAAEDDLHWKAGVFYVNREDPSLFLPERFGIGWTMNLGQPKAWAILGILAALVVAFVAACLMMAG